MPHCVISKAKLTFELADTALNAVLDLCRVCHTSFDGNQQMFIFFSAIDENGRQFVNFGIAPDMEFNEFDVFEVFGNWFIIALSNDWIEKLRGNILNKGVSGFYVTPPR
jgi:hypothetical protein